MTHTDPIVPTLPHWHADPQVRNTISRIRSVGMAITVVDDLCAECATDPDAVANSCAYAYTTGRSLAGEPELAVYGLDAHDAVDVLCDIIEQLDVWSWRRVVTEEMELYAESIDVPARLVEIVDTSDFRINHALFPNSVALQVVWPDDNGVYPWDQGYSLRPAAQFLKGVAGFAHEVGPRFIARSTGPNRAQRRKRKR